MNLLGNRGGMILLAGLALGCMLLALTSGSFRAKPAESAPSRKSSGSSQISKPQSGISQSTTAVLGQRGPKADSPDIAQLRAQVSQLELEVYKADPLLRACEQYEDKLEAWRDTGAQSTIHHYVVLADRSSPDSKLQSRRSHMVAVTANLMSPLMFKQFASTPGLSELSRWTLEMMRKENISLFRGVDPVLGIDSNVQLAPEAQASPADQLLAEIDARYDRITNAIARIAQQESMSEEVLQAIRNKHTFMMLIDMSRGYVLMRTPSELRDLRVQLRDAERAARNTKNQD